MLCSLRALFGVSGLERPGNFRVKFESPTPRGSFGRTKIWYTNRGTERGDEFCFFGSHK